MGYSPQLDPLASPAAVIDTVLASVYIALGVIAALALATSLYVSRRRHRRMRQAVRGVDVRGGQ